MGEAENIYKKLKTVGVPVTVVDDINYVIRVGSKLSESSKEKIEKTTGYRVEEPPEPMTVSGYTMEDLKKDIELIKKKLGI